MPGPKYHKELPAGRPLRGHPTGMPVPACRARGYTLIAHGDQPVTCGRCLRIKEINPAADRLPDACLIPHQSPVSPHQSPTTGPGSSTPLVPSPAALHPNAPHKALRPTASRDRSSEGRKRPRLDLQIRRFQGVETSPTSPNNRPHPASGPLHDYRDTFEAVLSLFPITRTPPAPHRPPKDTITGTPSDTTVASKLTEAGNGCSPGDYRDTLRYDHPCFS